MSTVSRPSIDRLSSDYQPIVDQVSTESRPNIDRLSTESRPSLDRLYRSIDRSTPSTVYRIRQNKNRCSCISLFCTLLCHFCTPTRWNCLWNCLVLLFWEDINKWRRNFVPFLNLKSSAPVLLVRVDKVAHPGYFKTSVGAQHLIRKSFFLFMQIKLIFTKKVVHLASFWKWGVLELGSGLLTQLLLIRLIVISGDRAIQRLINRALCIMSLPVLKTHKPYKFHYGTLAPSLNDG